VAAPFPVGSGPPGVIPASTVARPAGTLVPSVSRTHLPRTRNRSARAKARLPAAGHPAQEWRYQVTPCDCLTAGEGVHEWTAAAWRPLAALAGNTLVAAAVTDAWESARHKTARLFGRGQQDPATERRFNATRERLTAELAGPAKRATRPEPATNTRPCCPTPSGF
jgi:hypothetical protein